MTNEMELKFSNDAGEIFSQLCFITSGEGGDSVADSVQTIHNCYQIIEALTERISAELGGLTLIATDDNVKEMAESIKLKFAKISDEFLWRLAETESDWEDYSLIGMTSNFVKPVDDGNGETLLIPHLREGFQDVVGDDFTEEMFQSHLKHIKKQFNLGMSFR